MQFLLFQFTKKDDLLPDTGGKVIAVCQNESIQFGTVLTCQMVDYHEVQPLTPGIMTSAVEVRNPAI